MRHANYYYVVVVYAVDQAVVPAPDPPPAFPTRQLSHHVLPSPGVLPSVRVLLQARKCSIEVSTYSGADRTVD